jgi:hypothetical protein
MGKPKIEAPTPQIFRGRKIFTFLLFYPKHCQWYAKVIINGLTNLRGHGVPNLRLLPVSPHIVGFSPGVEDEHIKQANPN